MIGRPTKLTPEVQKAICDAIRAGNYIETASALAGITKAILYRWLKRGARAKAGIHHAFVDAVKKALAESEARDLESVRQASVGQGPWEDNPQWQAAAWRLERRFPKHWGRKERHEVTGKGGGPMQMEIIEELVDARTDGAVPTDSGTVGLPPQ